VKASITFLPKPMGLQQAEPGWEDSWMAAVVAEVAAEQHWVLAVLL